MGRPLAGLLLLAALGCRHSGALPSADGLEESATVAPFAVGPADLEARAVLAEAAGSTDLNVRRRALGFLVRASPSPGGGEWGPRGRHDPSEFVRREVVESLRARAGDSAAAELLRGLAEDARTDAITRMTAALALRSLQGPLPPEWAHRLSLEAHGLDRGPLLLPEAAAGSPEAGRALAEFLGAGSLLPDRAWLTALGRHAPPACAPALASAIGAAEPEYALLFAATLLPAAPDAARPVLEHALLGGDTERALDALDLLRDLRSPAADALVDRAARHGRRPVREVARWMQVERGAAPSGLASALRSADLDVRIAALRAAGALRGRGAALSPEERAAVVALAEPTSDAGTQLAAVEALTRHADDADRSTLTPRLRDENPLVRVIAAEAWPAVAP